MKKLLSILMVSVVVACGFTSASATPIAPVTQQAQASGFVSCYWSLSGDYWCYRYGCTYYERLFYRCTNGWIAINRPWYA